MALLVVGGITVPIAISSTPSRTDEELGDRDRAFDGTMRETIIATKHNYTFETTRMVRADADALVAALKATPPVTCSGDMLGASGSYFAQVTDYRGAKGSDTRYVVTFMLMEA